MRKGVAMIIQNTKGEYLLHLRDNKASWMKNEWCLIGGSIDGCESGVDAIRREVKEELGVEAGKIDFFKIIQPKGDTEVEIFHTRIGGNEKIILTEGKRIKFFSEKQLENLFGSLNYSNSYLEVLKEYISLR